MTGGPGCQVNAAIERALQDGRSSYTARRVVVDLRLESLTTLATDEPVLDESLYTVFRGLPERLVPGARLSVWTRNRAGGDVELVWEATETSLPSGSDVPLAAGPHGDLLELAISGLETFCRARSGHVELDETRLALAPGVARRYLFLIPSLRRTPGWHPARPS